VVVRGCPPGTVRDRCESHGCGTAGKNSDARTWRRRLPADPEGEARPGDQCIVSPSRPRIALSDLPAEALVNKSVSIQPWRLELDLCRMNASKPPPDQEQCCMNLEEEKDESAGQAG
jgi:hypothetical protein